MENESYITNLSNLNDSIFVICDPTPMLNFFPINKNIISKIEVKDNNNILLFYNNSIIEYKKIEANSINDLEVVFLYNNNLYVPVIENLLEYSPMFLDNDNHINNRIIIYGTIEKNFKIIIEISKIQEENEYNIPFNTRWGGVKFAFTQENEYINENIIQKSINNILLEISNINNIKKILNEDNIINESNMQNYENNFLKKIRNVNYILNKTNKI